ncbi:DNA-binding CsgD family transcriptional regulator [Streptomyces umbrinus]|uniref:DNA-binding CsgD family transcriptional regulator n=1 Tax=Streptomyces umbrinus TaxID=67370 RepID=A0ABU0T8V8_9ACTN|nr:DNA-binding CsgD family transcriptional regulator [Streptomyces umbrinus]
MLGRDRGQPVRGRRTHREGTRPGSDPTEAGAHLLRDLAAAVKGSGLVARLERLGASTVRFAWACAVLGTEIPPVLAAAVAGLGSEEAADAADALRGARILTGADTLEFVHPLIATAVYRAIPRGVRVALHGQAAWCVVDAGLGSAAAARHLMETHPDGDVWVVQQLRAAARETLRAGAPDAARRHLARALREPPPARERAAVLYELGSASLLTEPATTVNHLRAALEEPIADTELRHNIVYRLSQVLAHSDRLAEASDALSREIKVTGDARVRLRMQSEQFMWDAFRADEPDSPARSRRLARLADRLTGRDLTERYVIGLRAWDATLRGEPAHIAIRHAERALAGGFGWAEADRGFEVPVLVALTFMYADRPGRTEELFAAGIADFERQGWHGAHLSFGYTLLAYVRFRRGRLAEAEDFVRAGLRLAERVGPGTPAHWYAVGTLIDILLARGRITEATQTAEEYAFGEPFPAAVVFPDAQTVYGELLLARGLTKDAAVELAAAGRRLDPRGMRNPSWCPWQLHLARAESHDAPERAVATAFEAVGRARLFGAPSAIGQALRAAADVSSGPARVKLLEESVGHLESSPAAYELACALVALGTELRRAGRKEASEHLYRGLEAAAQCGADGLVEAARDELAAAGLRPRRLHSTETDTLTARERAAAALTARGRTLAGIAEELHTEEPAVVRLLSAVYRKVGTDRGGAGGGVGGGGGSGESGHRGRGIGRGGGSEGLVNGCGPTPVGRQVPTRRRGHTGVGQQAWAHERGAAGGGKANACWQTLGGVCRGRGNERWQTVGDGNGSKSPRDGQRPSVDRPQPTRDGQRSPANGRRPHARPPLGARTIAACPSSAAAAPLPPGLNSTFWPWTRATGPAI